VKPALLLAPRYERLAGNDLQPIGTSAEVVEFLASCCHDLERTGTAGMAAIVHLASSCPAYRLRFSDVDSAAALVEQAFASTAGWTTSPPPRRLDASDSTPSTPGLLHRRPGSTAWLFGDGSGVVFHPTALRLARLDTLGCALWEVLAGPDTLDAIAADAPNVELADGLRSWAERLLEAGLLART
jgi:hypothetical protein